jgi:hypothetical protein
VTTTPTPSGPPARPTHTESSQLRPRILSPPHTLLGRAPATRVTSEVGPRPRWGPLPNCPPGGRGGTCGSHEKVGPAPQRAPQRDAPHLGSPQGGALGPGQDARGQRSREPQSGAAPRRAPSLNPRQGSQRATSTWDPASHGRACGHRDRGRRPPELRMPAAAPRPAQREGGPPLAPSRLCHPPGLKALLSQLKDRGHLAFGVTWAWARRKGPLAPVEQTFSPWTTSGAGTLCSALENPPSAMYAQRNQAEQIDPLGPAPVCDGALCVRACSSPPTPGTASNTHTHTHTHHAETPRPRTHARGRTLLSPTPHTSSRRTRGYGWGLSGNKRSLGLRPLGQLHQDFCLGSEARGSLPFASRARDGRRVGTGLSQGQFCWHDPVARGRVARGRV